MRKPAAISKCIIVSMVCALFVIIFCAINPVGAQEVPEQVIQAAEKGLLEFLNQFQNMMEKGAGFRVNELGIDSDCFSQGIHLEKPFQVNRLTRETLSDYKNTPIENIIVKTDLWYFPVCFNGKAKTVLLVDKLKGSWQAVGIGSAPLARELGKVLKAWPLDEGFTPTLICYGYKKHFFTIPQQGAYNLTAIDFSNKDSDYVVLNDAETVLSKLAQSVLEDQ